MSLPLVSIGISFKNPGEYFRFALQSVFAQTFQDWELILMDDGTTDGSESLANALVDPRVLLLQDGHSRNLNVRLNEMVRVARGKYFFRMDADDVMHPERVSRQVAALEQSSNNTVIGSAAYSINSTNEVVGFRPAPRKQQINFAARHSFIHPTVCASREWFLKNPYSESFLYHRAQDAELWCRTSKTTHFEVLNDPLLFYRESDTFSFPNYLGTSMGVFRLVNEYTTTTSEFLRQITCEAGKLWLVNILYKLNRIDLVADRRFESVSEAQKADATGILESLLAYSLPLVTRYKAA